MSWSPRKKKKRFGVGLVWFGCLDVPVRELLLISRPRVGLTRRKDSREGKARLAGQVCSEMCFEKERKDLDRGLVNYGRGKWESGKRVGIGLIEEKRKIESEWKSEEEKKGKEKKKGSSV